MTVQFLPGSTTDSQSVKDLYFEKLVATHNTQSGIVHRQTVHHSKRSNCSDYDEVSMAPLLVAAGTGAGAAAAIGTPLRASTAAICPVISVAIAPVSC